MKRVRILGAGMRARQVVDLIGWQFRDEYSIEGYYDDAFPIGAVGPRNLPILGTVSQGIDDASRAGCSVFIAMGTKASAKGCDAFLALRERKVHLISLLSRDAHISPSAKIGENVVVFPGVMIGCESVLGNIVCVYGGTVIEHDGLIGNNITLGPGVALAGCTQIGSHSFVGVGCSAKPEVKVGSGTLIGAGSVLVTDIPSHVIAFGQPALPKRAVRSGDEVPTEQEVQRLAQKGF